MQLKKPPGQIYFSILQKNGIIPNGLQYGDIKNIFAESWLEMSKQVPPDFKDRYASHKNGCNGWWIDLINTFVNKMNTPKKIQKGVYGEIFKQFDDPDIWSIEPTFEKLREFTLKNGIGLGIISNWDLRLRQLLINKNLIGYFEHVIISAEFGYEKPSLKIFEEGNRLTSYAGKEIIYVGDKPELDYYPPLQLGWSVYLKETKPNQNHFQTIKYLSDIIDFCKT
ncbi:MAG: HAD-IA family hydrolase [Leptospiraceae bacterium]|nr:HAD-IA family hydrolase [Leptospiraceae bacterium]MCP5494993.1 HAD-IA family hydrolase [Leptospiraceae bacterium]